MAQFGKDASNFCAQRAIRIIASESLENFTNYVIEVTIGPYSWIVRHRYSEFHDLHEKLVSLHHIEKHLLPPKKLFGNHSEVFIKKRQNDLQTYLHSLLALFSTRLPAPLAAFLDFHLYEIHGITQALAEELYHRGDLLLQAKDLFQVSTLQLHALTERLKLPEPTCDSGDVKKDIGHILDFITRVYSLKICGTREHVGSSNIDMNLVKFDLTLFKSLKHLQLVNCNHQMMQGLITVKQTVETLDVHHSIKALRDILSQEAPYWRPDNNATLVTYWTMLMAIDLSYNSITSIDDSVQLMPNVESVNLSHNHLESVAHLQLLCHLTHLDLSYNCISHLDSLHTKLGNLKSLNVTGNKLESMQGFSKLFSLQVLNLTSNEISQLLEVKHVSQLPCLENLMLVGNPVVIVPDYRTKVLEMFGDRTAEVTLDNVATTQQEFDTVSVLQAIHKAREGKGKHKQKHSQKKTPSEVPITDLEQENTDQQSVDALTTGTHLTLQTHTHDLRSTVETMRTQGGDDWLCLLNKLRRETPSPQLSQQTYVIDETETSTEAFSPEAFSPEAFSPSPPIRECVTLHSDHHEQISGHLIQGQGAAVSQHDMQPVYNPVRSSGNKVIQSNAAVFSAEVNKSTAKRKRHVERSRLNGSAITKPLESISAPDRMFLDETGADVTPPLMSRPENTGIVNNNGPEELSDKSMFLVPEILPNLHNTRFLSKLRKRLLATEDDDSLKSGLPCMEKIADSVWCYVIQYTYPGLRMPACVTLTNRHVFIQHLKMPDAGCTEPDLETYYIMPLINIQQIVIGHDWSYVRLQESFVGPTGTFTIIGFDTASVKDFVTHLRSGLQPKVTAESLASQTDVVDLSIDGISAIVSQIAELEMIASSDINVCFFNVGQIDYYPACLIVTENKVYMFRDNCGQIPPPTYELSTKVTTQFELLQSHSIMSKISDLQLYDLSTRVLSEGPFNSRLEGHKFLYEEYGISMLFHEDDGQKPMLLDVCLPSLKIRSEFLEKLTQIRSDFARNLSPMHREDPEGEGCNEMSLQMTVVSSPGGLDDAPLKTSNDQSPNDESKSFNKRPLVVVEETVVPTTHTTRSFTSLELSYPSSSLLNHLDKCLRSYDLLEAMPPTFEYLANMSSSGFVDYFHSNLAQIGQNCEELRHILWTNVIPYKNPCQELLSCVIITTKLIYLLSEDRVIDTQSRPSWMAHCRHRSDTPIHKSLSSSPDQHNSSGILLKQKYNHKRILKTYKIYKFKEIRQVNFGVFNQCVRLTGEDDDSVYTLVTRNANITDDLQQQLIATFSLQTASPIPELERSTESDFYDIFRRTASMTEAEDTSLLNKNRFRFPTEELLSDWSFVIKSSITQAKPDAFYDITFYVLGYFYQGPYIDGIFHKSSRRSIISTNRYLCLCIEDLVSYPIPDFARGLPVTPRQEISDVRQIEQLKRVALYGDFALTLIFSDEIDDIIVDTSFEHFSSRNVDQGRQSPPELSWTFLIQTQQNRDRFVEVLTQHWADVSGGAQLMVHHCDDSTTHDSSL